MGTQRNEADKLQSEVWIRRTKKSHQGQDKNREDGWENAERRKKERG